MFSPPLRHAADDFITLIIRLLVVQAPINIQPHIILYYPTLSPY